MKRAKASGTKDRVTLALYNKLTDLTALIAELVDIQELTDTIILQVMHRISLSCLVCLLTIGNIGLSVSMSVCFQVCLFLFLCVSISACFQVCLFLFMSVSFSVCFYVCLFPCLFIFLSLSMSVCFCVYLFVLILGTCPCCLRHFHVLGDALFPSIFVLYSFQWSVVLPVTDIYVGCFTILRREHSRTAAQLPQASYERKSTKTVKLIGIVSYLAMYNAPLSVQPPNQWSSLPSAHAP